MNITLKTARFYGQFQVVVVAFFGFAIPFFIWQFYKQGSFEKDFYITIFLVAGCSFFYWRILVSLSRAWFTDAFTIELSEELIRYRNLLGSQAEIKISDIVRVENIRSGFIGLAFITNDGTRFAPNLNIDYLHFIYDFLIERVPDRCVFESDEILRLRSDPSSWMYQRHTYFGARYGKDEIAQIEAFVNEQYQDLVSRGILKTKPT